MAAFIFRDAKVALGGRNITGLLNNVALEYSAELKDDTVLGDSTRSRLSGLKDASATMQGFWDVANDLAIFTGIGGSGEIFSMAPGGHVEGDRAFTFQTESAEYVQGAEIGEIAPFTLNAQGNGDLIGGTLMTDQTVTATANGDGVQLGALSATQRMYAALHVVAVDGTNPTLDVTIESAPTSGFASPVTRITFTQVTASVASELLNVAGAITNTHWRVTWTITDDSGGSPSYTLFVVLGIV